MVDDYWAPSVRTALRYYQQNLGWTAVPDAFANEPVAAIGADPHATPVTRLRALRLPDHSFEPPFEEFRPF